MTDALLDGYIRLLAEVARVPLPDARWSPLGHGYWPYAESREEPHRLLVARQLRWGMRGSWLDLFRRLEDGQEGDGDRCVVGWRGGRYQLVRSLGLPPREPRERTRDPEIDASERADERILMSLRRVRIDTSGAPECAVARSMMTRGLTAPGGRG